MSDVIKAAEEAFRADLLHVLCVISREQDIGGRLNLHDAVAAAKHLFSRHTEKLREERDALQAQVEALQAENERLKDESETRLQMYRNEHAAHADTMRARLRAEQERDDLQRTFDLRWKADMRAIKRWHEAGNPELVWPDHADLCVWLLEKLEHK